MTNPAFSKVSIANTFAIPVDPTKMMFKFNDASSPYIPPASAEYVFRATAVTELISFLRKPDGDAFFITGPTGSGKTSLVLETAARLNWPVQSLTCNGRMEAADLIGMYVLRAPAPGADPITAWQYGPLPMAMKLGHILLLNEVDMMAPEELAALNDVLEGRPLVIGANGGEVVKPHPMFRVIVTGNSVGGGDESQAYQGVMKQNIASMDRYWFMNVGYAPEHVEQNILASASTKVPENIRNRMVTYANEVRGLFESRHLSITFSTRTLLRWCRLASRFRGSVDPNNNANSVGYALEMAFLRRLGDQPEQREALLRLARDVFGQDNWVDGEVAEPGEAQQETETAQAA
tara:strand:- start:1756 stop:2799 length:1044 start_codon:yes stop_codon:yes gene_type:complete